MKPILQPLFLIATLITLWFGMMAFHETGHILAAILTGGHVERLLIPLNGFSRTEISDNPHPLVVAWAGPIFGSVLPLASALALRGSRFRIYLLDLFTGFCLIANGAYIGLGSFDRIGDAGDLIRYGSPSWLLWIFGIAAGISGLMVWHDLGNALGLQKRWRAVDGWLAIACTCVLILIIFVTK